VEYAAANKPKATIPRERHAKALSGIKSNIAHTHNLQGALVLIIAPGREGNRASNACWSKL
jgi:hypothetical protein